jgi:hypothetical protein
VAAGRGRMVGGSVRLTCNTCHTCGWLRTQWISSVRLQISPNGVACAGGDTSALFHHTGFAEDRVHAFFTSAARAILRMVG